MGLKADIRELHRKLAYRGAIIKKQGIALAHAKEEIIRLDYELEKSRTIPSQTDDSGVPKCTEVHQGSSP